MFVGLIAQNNYILKMQQQQLYSETIPRLSMVTLAAPKQGGSVTILVW